MQTSPSLELQLDDLINLDITYHLPWNGKYSYNYSYIEPHVEHTRTMTVLQRFGWVFLDEALRNL